MSNDLNETVVAPESVSQEVTAYLGRIADRAEKVGCRIDEQLQPICMQATPLENTGSDDDDREYPAYFSNLREKIRSIEYAVKRINDVLDRCEIC